MFKALVSGFVFCVFAGCVATEQETPSEPADIKTDLETVSEPKEPAPQKPTEPSAKYTPVRFNLSSPTAEPSAVDKKRCADVGGKVQRAGLRGSYHCVQTFPDAGKVCRDSAECVGSCRTEDSKAVGLPGTGTCQQVDVPFGCYALVRDGVVDGGMLCVD